MVRRSTPAEFKDIDMDKFPLVQYTTIAVSSSVLGQLIVEIL